MRGLVVAPFVFSFRATPHSFLQTSDAFIESTRNHPSPVLQSGSDEVNRTLRVQSDKGSVVSEGRE
jgi:hypothetical protein